MKRIQLYRTSLIRKSVKRSSGGDSIHFIIKMTLSNKILNNNEPRLFNDLIDCLHIKINRYKND